MSVINVKAKPGTVVRETVNGKVIPTDRFVPVTLTRWILRHIEHWGDLEVETAPAAALEPPAVEFADPPSKKKS